MTNKEILAFVEARSSSLRLSPEKLPLAALSESLSLLESLDIDINLKIKPKSQRKSSATKRLELEAAIIRRDKNEAIAEELGVSVSYINTKKSEMIASGRLIGKVKKFELFDLYRNSIEQKLNLGATARFILKDLGLEWTNNNKTSFHTWIRNRGIIRPTL